MAQDLEFSGGAIHTAELATIAAWNLVKTQASPFNTGWFWVVAMAISLHGFFLVGIKARLLSYLVVTTFLGWVSSLTAFRVYAYGVLRFHSWSKMSDSHVSKLERQVYTWLKVFKGFGIPYFPLVILLISTISADHFGIDVSGRVHWWLAVAVAVAWRFAFRQLSVVTIEPGNTALWSQMKRALKLLQGEFLSSLLFHICCEGLVWSYLVASEDWVYVRYPPLPFVMLVQDLGFIYLYVISMKRLYNAQWHELEKALEEPKQLENELRLDVV